VCSETTSRKHNTPTPVTQFHPRLRRLKDNRTVSAYLKGFGSILPFHWCVTCSLLISDQPVVALVYTSYFRDCTYRERFEIWRDYLLFLDAPKVGHVIVLHGFGNRSLETLDGYTKYRAAYGDVPRINLYIHTYSCQSSEYCEWSLPSFHIGGARLV
jgi:hypothetical protein